MSETLGTLLLAGSLAVHFSDVTTIQRTVAPGASGLAIALLSLAAVPNGSVLASSYMSGAGFHLGAATSVSVMHTDRGTLPLFPLLGALPRAGGLSVPGLVLAILACLAISATVVLTVARGRHQAQACGRIGHG